MKISMVIPCHNAAPYLAQAVESLMATGYDDLEVLIVDDGSVDGSREVAEQLAGSHAQVRALAHDGHANRGAGLSRNLAIERASGDIVGFLDADDYVHPHRFDVAQTRLRSREVDGVYETVEIRYDGLDRSEPWAESFCGIRGTHPRLELLALLLGGKAVWIPSAFLCRRSLFERSGLFPAFKAEDLNLWLRMACVGNLVEGDQERPVAVYRRHPGNHFHHGPDNIRDNVRALAHAARWVVRHRCSPDIQELLRNGLSNYLNQACYDALRLGRPALALQMVALTAAFGHVRTVCQYRILRQAASAIAGLLRRSQHRLR